MAGQYRFKDINGNIVAQISASAAGAISFSGSAVDFSNASTITLGEVQLAGTASNALLLDGFDSTAFVFTSSFNTISQSISSQLTTLQTTSGSNIGRLNNLESKSSSVDISISNINTVTESVLSRTSNLESKSSSVDISISSINQFTASNSNTSLNNLTGSLATTGSNTFFGTQTYSGSVYIANDLIVQGSSSIQYISASSVSIGTNIVQLNTANPSVRFAGLTIIDSGSIGGSGSFLYDSVHDEFIFVHRGNGTNVTSSHFVLGPETFDNLGNETYLTCNIITKGTGKEHLVDSCIFDNGITTCIKNNLVGTGTITGTTIYGSTVVCSPVGKFTSCIDAGTGTFSGALQGDYLVVGTVAATSGGLRLGTQVAIRARNVANTANIPLIESTATDGVSVSNGALIITCTGRVGIGQTAPGVQLSVGGQSEQWQLGVATLCGTSGALIGSPSANILAFGNWAGTERMRIDASGNVGIGTCVPSDRLSITDASTYTFNIGAAAGGSGAVLYTLGSAALTFATCGSSNERMRITSTGQVAIGATSNLNNFTIKSSSDTITAGGLSFQSRTAVTNYIAMGLNSSNDFEIQTWTTPSWLTRMYIKNNGNIGFGTTIPDAKLHICNAVAGGTNNYLIIVQNCCTVADARAGIAFSNNSQTPSAGGLSGASIQSSNNGIDGAGNLLFSTLISGTNCERMRIASSGLVTKPYQTYFNVRASVNQAVNAEAKISYDTIVCSVGGNFNTTTSRFTAPVAGIYVFSLSNSVVSGGIHTYHALYIQVNGTSSNDLNFRFRGASNSCTGQWFGIGGTVQLNLAANDYVEIFGYTDTTIMTLQSSETRWQGYLQG